MASRIVLAVAVLVVAACGGSSRLSRSEFVQRANAVCTKYEQKVTRAMAGINPGDQTQLASAIGKALPVIREGNDELRALKPPEDLQQRFDRWLRIADNEVAAATELRDGLKKDDAKAVQRAFQKLRVSDAAQDTVARKGLGLTRCASRPAG
jgi:sugar-specific transcriptional regulator TrmB